MKAGAQAPGQQWLVGDKSHGWIDSTGWVFQGLSTGELQFGVGQGSGGTTNFGITTSTTSLLGSMWH